MAQCACERILDLAQAGELDGRQLEMWNGNLGLEGAKKAERVGRMQDWLLAAGKQKVGRETLGGCRSRQLEVAGTLLAGGGVDQEFCSVNASADAVCIRKG